jgi:hypothetical protein
MSLSGFLRQAALEKSDAVLKNRDNITLSDRDRDLFLEALENPPKPNERLIKAFKTYEEKKTVSLSPVLPLKGLNPELPKYPIPIARIARLAVDIQDLLN